LNGNFQVVQREIVNGRKISPAVEATKSTIYRADSYGGFSQVQQSHELKSHNADGSVVVKRTTLVPDGNANWKVNDVTDTIIMDDAKNRTTEERFSRPDLEGRLLETSRILAKQEQTATGERRSTVETYSVFAPGYFDSSLRLHQRVRTIQRKGPGGETSVQQIEQPSAGNPSDGPKVTARTKYVVRYATTGTESKKTIEARDANGNFNMISIGTRKSTQTSLPQSSPPRRDEP
jgi:hypothetical protein